MLQTTHKRRRDKRVTGVAVFALAMLGFATLLYGVKAADHGNPSAKIKDLQKQRADTLHEARNFVIAAFKASEAGFDEVLSANLAALDADLDVAETPEQRIRLLVDALKQAREFEETMVKLVQAGQANRHAVLKAKAARLAREIALEQTPNDSKK